MPRCHGLGIVDEIDLEKVIPNQDLSIHDGAIVPLGKYKNQMIFWQIDAILQKHGCNLKTPYKDIPSEAIDEVMNGSLEAVRIDKSIVHTSSDYFVSFDGVVKYLTDVMSDDESAASQKWAAQFLATSVCPECHGNRLKKESLAFKVGDKNICEVANLDISELSEWLATVEDKLTTEQENCPRDIERVKDKGQFPFGSRSRLPLAQ